MADRESTQEISPKTFSIVSHFDRTFKKHFRHQKLFLGGQEKPEFPQYRALKRTFDELAEIKLSNDQIKEVVQHMVNDERYSEVFREWVQVQGKNWDAHQGPQNIHRIYALGRNELLRTKGKKAISG